MLGRMLRRLLGLGAAPKPKQSPPAAAPATQPVAPKPAISDTVLARARSARPLLQRRDMVDAKRVFSGLPSPPFEVPADIIAQDSADTYTDWAGMQLSALNDRFLEGTTFLGYAYLAELAQRPEYRMICETLATEMTRRWIKFTSTKDEDEDEDSEKTAERIKELEAEFARLGVRDVFCRAIEQDGYFGRAHIYIKTKKSEKDDNEKATPLGTGWDKMSAAKVGKDNPVTGLRTVEAVWCYPTNYNSNDPLSDSWYNPTMWLVQATRVHSSRLLTLVGRPVPDLLKPTYSFGGLSMTQMAKPYVDNWLETRQSVNDILQSFTQWVLKTDLAATLQGNGDEMFARAEVFNAVKDTRGLMMLNKTEEFDNVSAPLAGLEALQAQAQEHMSSVSHIPLVKLLGTSPAGLNASSEGELRSFYDWIHASQEHQLRDKIHKLMGLVMLSLWDEVDDNIGFEFEPLWAMDEEQLANIQKTKADTDQIYVDMGALDAEEVRRRIAADPDSGHSSIDVDDVPDLAEEEAEGLEPVGGRPQPVAENDVASAEN